MPKEKLTLSVDKEVIEKAKNLGINISEITERVLKVYTSAERPVGSMHDAYMELFGSIQPLLKEFDCNVRVAESWIEVEDPETGETQRLALEEEAYLAADGSFLIKTDLPAPEDYHIHDIRKIKPEEFLTPQEILTNLINELAKSQEKRKKKMDEILMAKRIIDAMSASLLKQPQKEK
jgi:hypothetical protein